MPSTLETKDFIDNEQLMKMPKRATLINMACSEEVLEAEMLEVLSVRPDFLLPLHVPAREDLLRAVRGHHEHS